MLRRLRSISGLALGAVLLSPLPAPATTFTVLHSFSGGLDGGMPEGALIADSAGVLYGTTFAGAINGNGVVFKLDPTTKVLSVLHFFVDTSDGKNPKGGLLMDADGMLYGTTSAGGKGGYGTVFKLDPATKLVTTLHAFSNGEDGGNPYAGVVFDNSGMLVGTTLTGGAKGAGTAFSLDPATKRLTTLHAFANGKDGGSPTAPLLRCDLDTLASPLCGTTSVGGAHEFGTVFGVDPTTDIVYPLFAFDGGINGGTPYGGLVSNDGYSMFGTASIGGASGYGLVFVLTTWNLQRTTLHTFGNRNDGRYPLAGLVLVPNEPFIYGVTSQGGARTKGTLFSIDRFTKDFQVLHSFSGGNDGGTPVAPLLAAAGGALYGTASEGGAKLHGTLFKVTP